MTTDEANNANSKAISGRCDSGFFVLGLHHVRDCMNAETENAIRSVAKTCRSEIIAQTKGQPKKNHDPIITRILDKHAKRITALPPGTFSAKRWLSYFVRVVDAEANK